MPHAKRPSAAKNAQRAAQKLAALKQSGPLVRRLHSSGTKTAGVRGPGHLLHTRLPLPMPCEFFVKCRAAVDGHTYPSSTPRTALNVSPISAWITRSA